VHIDQGDDDRRRRVKERYRLEAARPRAPFSARITNDCGPRIVIQA
jgi:hypothetical protein